MAKFDYRKLAARIAGKPPELMFSVVAGTTANTNIAVTSPHGSASGGSVSIGREDGLLAVLEFQDTAGATVGIVADRVGEASVTSDGNIQLTTTNTTGKGLLVIWLRHRV